MGKRKIMFTLLVCLIAVFGIDTAKAEELPTENEEQNIMVYEEEKEGQELQEPQENIQSEGESSSSINDGEKKLEGWHVISGNHFYYIDNTPIRGEALIDGKWYYFSPETGIMQTGFQKVGKRTVCYAQTGEMLFGEQIIDGKEYFFNTGNGDQYIGIFTDDSGNVKCYAKEGGYVLGEFCIDGKWYFFSPETGHMQKGFQQVGSRTVYYDESGTMVFGELLLNGNWYYFHKNNGNIQTGFQKVGKRTVYYAPTGEMLFGEQVIDGKVYYFDEGNGDQYIGLFTGEDGKIKCYAEEGDYVSGEICLNGDWYYFDEETNEMWTGLQQVGSRTVYYNEDGTMLFGEKMIDGKWYFFSKSNGNMQTGFQKVGKRTVYYASTGEMLFGSQKINGKKYYFNESNGNMLVSGWYDGEYYDANGVCTGPLAGKIEELKKYVYVPYVWGGVSPMGWDCSGFTQWALHYIAGINIPRLSQDQAVGGQYVDPSNMNVWQPGDVLCYWSGGTVGHTAVYLGNGMLMHALNENYGTLIQSVSYYEQWDSGTYLCGVRRYI